MTSPKYKINFSHLDEGAGIARLEADGHSREAIHKEMYRITDGASTPERNKLMKKLYQRPTQEYKKWW